MALKIEDVLSVYIDTRNDIAELERQISEHKALQAKREEWLNQQLSDLGVENVKTKVGTVFTQTAESVTISDGEIFMNWVLENEAWDCLERRASKAGVLNRMGEKEDSGRPNPLPPGLDYKQIRQVRVRKS